jgi:D-glycero-alpha-D-manno-heptose-7-phosphate kinase
MILSRTPYRISLFGGGTDYPAWYRAHGGAVVGTTINKFCYISIRRLPPFFEHKHRIVYSQIELPQTVAEILHPAVRAVLTEQSIEEGVEIQHHGDLPARSGMGSSSSFTVGLLNSVRAYKGLMSSPEWLAKEAIRIEQEVIKEDVGSQDQIWAAYGGTNLITFYPNGEFRVTPIIIAQERREELEAHLMLVFTGFARTAALLAKKQIQNLNRHEKQLLEMREMVDEAVQLLQNCKRPLTELGLMLNDMWKLKKELADSISNPAVDGIYTAALEAGAVGGKLVGAGGGGFMLLVVEPECRAVVRERLRSLIEVSFEIGSSGSKIAIYEPDQVEVNRTYPVSAD